MKRFFGYALIVAGTLGIIVATCLLIGFSGAGTIFQIPFAVVGTPSYGLIVWSRSPVEVGGALTAELQEDKLAWFVTYKNGEHCAGLLLQIPPEKRHWGFGRQTYCGSPASNVELSDYCKLQAPPSLLLIIFTSFIVIGLKLLGVFKLDWGSSSRAVREKAKRDDECSPECVAIKRMGGGWQGLVL